jgi:polysaccharide biosynthesis transport protein
MSKVSKTPINPCLTKQRRLALRDGGSPQLGLPRSPYTDAICDGTSDGNSDVLAEYWQILRRRKVTLLLTTVVGMIIGLFFARVQSPSYRARTLIEVEDLNEDFLNMRSVNPTASKERFQSPDYLIRTQTLIVQSRPVLERALGRLDLEARLLARKPRSPVLSWIRNPAPARENLVPRQEQALNAVAAGLQVQPLPSSQIIEVRFDSADPQLSADLVNSIASSFTELGLERRRQASQTTSLWLNQRLAEVRTKLESTEDALQKYARGSDLGFITDKDNSAEERLRQLQLDLLKAQENLFAKQSVNELVATVPPESLPEVLDDATLKEYQTQLVTLRRQLADLRSSFTDEHPKVANVKAQIVAMETALEKRRGDIVSRIRNEYTAASRNEKLLGANYAAQTGVVSAEASRIAHYSVLKREVDTNRQLYDLMLQRVREADLASAIPASDTRVVEPAAPPRSPYKSNVVFDALLGSISGMITGAALIISRARSYCGIQDPGQVAIELQVPELGLIPATSKQRSRVAGLLGINETHQLELTTWQHWPSLTSESFRFALTSILLSEKNGAKPRVLAISSANPGEGKTTVISNLGIALARINRRVLLIDGDMRKPRLHQIFDVDNEVGLSNILAGNSSLAVQATKIPNLFVLPSGRDADEHLIFTGQLRQLIRRLRKQFDMVLLDTPPLLQISDARLISRLADAVVLVVAQHTHRTAIRVAQQRLAEDGSFLLGTILNNWNPKTGSNGYGRYYSDSYKHYYRKSEVGLSG